MILRMLVVGVVLSLSMQNTQAGTIVDLSNGVGGDGGNFGSGSGSAVIDDAFTYNPDADYTDLSGSGPTQPTTGFGAGSYISINNDGVNFWTADVTLDSGETLDFLDIWGRTAYAGVEESRHQNLAIIFFDGAGATGSVLGTSPAYSGVSAHNEAQQQGSAYGRFDVSTVLTATQRGQVASFTIDQTVATEYLLLAEVRAGSAVIPEPSSITLLVFGLLGLVVRRRRKS